jgi:hypothetical protein
MQHDIDEAKQQGKASTFAGFDSASVTHPVDRPGSGVGTTRAEYWGFMNNKTGMTTCGDEKRKEEPLYEEEEEEEEEEQAEKEAKIRLEVELARAFTPVQSTYVPPPDSEPRPRGLRRVLTSARSVARGVVGKGGTKSQDKGGGPQF